MKELFKQKRDFWWEMKDFYDSQKESDIKCEPSLWWQSLTTDWEWFYQILYWECRKWYSIDSIRTKVEWSWKLEEIIQWLEHCEKVDKEYHIIWKFEPIQDEIWKYYDKKSKEFLDNCKKYL